MSKAYPKYKPSGVEWLGDVPEHWGVKRLKFIGTSLIGLTYSPDDVVDEDYQGEKHLVLRSTNIQDGRITLHENVYVTTRVSKELKVRKWDILICARNGSRHLVGKNALINETDDHMTFGAFTTVFRSKINSFLFYYFSSSQFQYQSTGFLTTTINQLTNGNLNSIIATLPPLPEQQAIAAFLDRETKRIDSLIAKKQRLLELLTEQRTALISRVITKGLDAQVKLKPSGVEWLGDLPEHWGVKKLKYCLSLKTKKAITGNNPIALENIEGWTGRFIQTESEFEGEGIAFKSRDILFGKLRPYLAKVYLAEKAGESIGDIFVLEPTSQVVPRFGAECLRTENYIEIIDGSTYGSKMPRVSWEFMGSLPLPLPPLPEQQAIGAFLDRETAKIDALSAKVTAVIERLKEYRTALISSAVTGKIDVRDAR